MTWFNWLPLSDRKNITIPKVIVEPFSYQQYGGYCEPAKSIIVVVEHPTTDIPAALAHEFRHHIQYELNQHRSSVSSVMLEDASYEDMIHHYFTTQPHEYDALLYEYKYAKSDLNDWWLNCLTKEDR